MTGRFATIGLRLVALGLVAACAPPETETTDATPELRRLTQLPGNEGEAIVSPDGSRVAFVSESGAERRIFVIDFAGGSPTEIAATPQGRQENPAWSPDGRSLALTSDRSGHRAVWVADLEGTEPRRLTGPDLRASRPQWSPDGASIAFNGKLGDAEHVWTVAPAGGEPRQLTSDAGRQLHYGWSPDGRRLLALRLDSTSHDIWSLDPSDGSFVPLLEHGDEEWWPSWSPDGSSIAFYTSWGDRMTDIWTLDLASPEPLAITTHPGEDFLPRWSPDGRWLAFHSDRESKSGLWLAPASGGEPRPLVLSGRVPAPVAWSPDSRHIVFSYLETKAQLFEVPVAGGSAVPLTDGAFNVFNPAVASNGRVAFDSDRWNSERDLFLLDPNDGTPVSLTREIPNNGYPSWSPDGRWLTFKASQGAGRRTNEVWILDPEKPEQRTRLTTLGYVRFPVWCGDEIVFRYDDPSLEASRQGQIWSVPASGGTPRQLTTSKGTKTPSDCTRDGHRILFSVERGDNREAPAVVVLERHEDGRAPTETVIGPGEGGRWSPDETRIAFVSTRDGWCDLYVTQASPDSAERVTHTETCESWPDWSPAGDRILYAANPGDLDLWVVDVEAALARGPF